MRIGNANGIFASLGRMEAGHLAGGGTRHGRIRRVPERRRAGRDAWYQMPRLRTKSPLAALLLQRALYRDSTNAPLSHRLSCLARPRDIALHLVASRGPGAVTGGAAGEGAAGASAKCRLI